jgi:Tol biopolymer transport system component
VVAEGVQRIWIYDFARNGLTPLTTGDSSSQAPVWTHDGKRVAYRATRKGFRNIYWKAVDGSTDEERLTTGDNNQTPGSFSPDGKWLAYWEGGQDTGSDIWIQPLDGERKPQPFLKTAKNELNPRFSPDGHWIAYQSDESGKNEVYVRPFPGPGEKFPISVNGGTNPVWSRDGRELFYTAGRSMMAVDVRSQTNFSAGTPKKLYEGLFNDTGTGTSGFDVGLDGRHLRVERTGPEPVASQMNIVVNWIEELKKLAAQK